MSDTLEATFAATERAVDQALKAAAAATRELRKARAGAKTGQLRDLRKALQAAESAAAGLAGQARAARARLDASEQGYLASGAYTKELLATAATAGVRMYEEDDRLLCYPSLVRVLPGDAAVEIDRRRERRLRPSVLVGMLAAAQNRPPRFRPEPFLDGLRTGYELVVARDGKRPDAVVRLVDVWAALTLLPGQRRDYSKPEFARDLYLLDQSGVTSTPKSPRQLRWVAGTSTDSPGVLTTVARSGERRHYWGVSFSLPPTG
ncbi:MAG TPA: hypothetical protein VIL37_03590 [Natronosporangium sp.]